MSSYTNAQVEAATAAIGDEMIHYPTSVRRAGKRAWYVRRQNDGFDADFESVAGPFDTEKEAMAECRRILVRTVLSAAQDAAPEEALALHTPLGRFGHHPDPAIDFLVEFKKVENLYFDNKINPTQWPLPAGFADRIWKAMTFRAGGDANCVLAKQKLRKIEADLNGINHDLDSLKSRPTPPTGWALAPIDDTAKDFADSILPLAMIFAGADALERASQPSDIDWDHGMQAVAVYRAMTAAIPKPQIINETPDSELLIERDDFIVAKGLWQEFCAQLTTPVNNEAAVIKGIRLAADLIENRAPETSGADYGLSSESERAETRESERVCYEHADAIRALALRIEKSGS